MRFWMVRNMQYSQEYLLFRESRKPRLRKVKSPYGEDGHYMQWSQEPTRTMCARVWHRTFPDLPHMKPGDDPILIDIDISVASAVPA